MSFYQSTYFKGPEVLDKATHPIMPKVQKINTSNTPSPIPATKAMLYITQNSKRSSVYDRVAKYNLAAILDFEDASCRILEMSSTKSRRLPTLQAFCHRTPPPVPPSLSILCSRPNFRATESLLPPLKVLIKERLGVLMQQDHNIRKRKKKLYSCFFKR